MTIRTRSTASGTGIDMATTNKGAKGKDIQHITWDWDDLDFTGTQSVTRTGLGFTPSLACDGAAELVLKAEVSTNKAVLTFRIWRGDFATTQAWQASALDFMQNSGVRGASPVPTITPNFYHMVAMSIPIQGAKNMIVEILSVRTPGSQVEDAIGAVWASVI